MRGSSKASTYEIGLTDVNSISDDYIGFPSAFLVAGNTSRGRDTPLTGKESKEASQNTVWMSVSSDEPPPAPRPKK